MTNQNCYRHGANERPLTRMIEQDDSQLYHSLSAEQKQFLDIACSLYQNSNSNWRSLFLRRILSISCSKQISLISNEIENLNKVDIIGHLPNELAVLVLKKLDLKSIEQASRVSRRWYQLCFDDQLWRSICSQHIGRRCDGCGIGLPVVRYRGITTGAQQSCLMAVDQVQSSPVGQIQSMWKQIYKERYLIEQNWIQRRKVRTAQVYLNGDLDFVADDEQLENFLDFNLIDMEYCHYTSTLVVCHCKNVIHLFKINSDKENLKFDVVSKIYVPLDQITEMKLDNRKVFVHNGSTIMVYNILDGSLIQVFDVFQCFGLMHLSLLLVRGSELILLDDKDQLCIYDVCSQNLTMPQKSLCLNEEITSMLLFRKQFLILNSDAQFAVYNINEARICLRVNTPMGSIINCQVMNDQTFVVTCGNYRQQIVRYDPLTSQFQVKDVIFFADHGMCFVDDDFPEIGSYALNSVQDSTKVIFMDYFGYIKLFKNVKDEQIAPYSTQCWSMRHPASSQDIDDFQDRQRLYERFRKQAIMTETMLIFAQEGLYCYDFSQYE